MTDYAYRYRQALIRSVYRLSWEDRILLWLCSRVEW